MSCTNHLQTCNGDPSKCSSCFDGDDDICEPDCGTCFSPFNDAGIPSIDGVCVGTAALRTFVNEDVVSTVDAQVSLFTWLCQVVLSILCTHMNMLSFQKSLYTIILAQFINKNVFAGSEEVIEAVTTSENNVKNRIDTAETNIETTVNNQCRLPSRRLGQEQATTGFTDLLQSDEVREAKEFAQKQGLDEDDAEKVFSKVFDSMSDMGNVLREKIKEEVLKDFMDPEKMAFIEKTIGDDIEGNKDKYVAMFVGKVLEASMDEETRRLDGMCMWICVYYCNYYVSLTNGYLSFASKLMFYRKILPRSRGLGQVRVTSLRTIGNFNS